MKKVLYQCSVVHVILCCSQYLLYVAWEFLCVNLQTDSDSTNDWALCWPWAEASTALWAGYSFTHNYMAVTWSLKSPKVLFLNTWSLMSLNLKKWSLKSLFLCNWLFFNLSWLNFAKRKTDWHFSMVWRMDTFENSVQRNCVDNMTLNSLELRTELLHAFD